MSFSTNHPCYENNLPHPSGSLGNCDWSLTNDWQFTTVVYQKNVNRGLKRKIWLNLKSSHRQTWWQFPDIVRISWTSGRVYLRVKWKICDIQYACCSIDASRMPLDFSATEQRNPEVFHVIFEVYFLSTEIPNIKSRCCTFGISFRSSSDEFYNISFLLCETLRNVGKELGKYLFTFKF